MEQSQSDIWEKIIKVYCALVVAEGRKLGPVQPVLGSVGVCLKGEKKGFFYLHFPHLLKALPFPFLFKFT